MNPFDVRTILYSYVITNGICAVVMQSLWLQNRKRTAGLGYCLLDFYFQFISILLIGLRGLIPDFISIVVSNILSVAGTILLLIGLEILFDRKGSQIQNYVLLFLFSLIQIYFAFVVPNLTFRNINISVALFVLCGQSAWLMLHRVDPSKRIATRMVGVVFTIYCIAGLVRTVIDLLIPSQNELFAQSVYDTMIIFVYQMLFIALTFDLVLMVNRLQYSELEHDVTVLKLADEVIKKSEEKFSMAFHNIPDAIVITNMNTGKILEVNESFYRITGFTKAEIVGKTSIELDLWGTIEDRKDYIKKLNQMDKVLDFETKFRKKSGKVFPALVSGELITLSEGVCILNVIRDVTDQKLAEERIERLASFPRLNPNPVMEVDVNGVITYANEATQVALEKIGAKDPRVFLPRELDAILKDTDQNVSMVYQAEINYGQFLFTVFVHYAPSFHAFRLYITDITERRFAENKLREANVETQRLLVEAERSRRTLLSVVEDQKEAEDKIRQLNQDLEQRVSERTAELETSNKELEAFAYSVSHDLRAPLRAIDGYSRILEEENSDKFDEDGRQILKIIRDSTKKMDQLIADLLALSRVSRIQLAFIPIDMTSLVMTVFNEMVTVEVKEKVHFQVSELPTADGDMTLIRQVWSNLITNAVKYTKLNNDRRIEVRGSIKKGVCTYSIHDNGVGFNAKYTDKLFGLFQRLHKEKEFEGTGVGLAIVKRIIGRHGGEVWAEGKENGGATFSFSLPQHPKE
jgi:PAS domain S-box-containing protein